MRAALDEERHPRDFEDGQTLIVIDVPIAEDGADNTLVFHAAYRYHRDRKQCDHGLPQETTTLQDISGNMTKIFRLR